MFTTVYGRVQASPGGNGKLVWDVLPARARVATSLRKGDVLRQQSALHAHDVVYLATAASGAMSDGLSMSNLATTVSAGLLLLLGVASVSQQKSPETGTQKVFATAASPSGTPQALRVRKQPPALCVRTGFASIVYLIYICTSRPQSA